MEKIVDSINTVEELIEALDNINYNWFELTKWYASSMVVFDNDKPEVKRVDDACIKLLVNADGSINNDAVDIIRSNGYKVIAMADSGIITCNSGIHSELHYGNTALKKCEVKKSVNDISAEPKTPTIDTLISVLNELYSKMDELITSCKCDEDDIINAGKRFFDSDKDEVSKAIILCNSFLIDCGGGCNWNNIYHLIDSGYKVYAGESDSFGWLTGCVEKVGSKTVLVYG